MGVFDDKYPALSEHYASIGSASDLVRETQRLMRARLTLPQARNTPPFSPATTVAVLYFHRRRKREIRAATRAAQERA